MSFGLPNDEQEALVRGVADALAARFPVDRFRQEGAAADRDRWADLAGLGLFGLSLPEAEGGLGLGMIEEAMIAREAGRQLLSPALIAAMAAPQVARRAGRHDLAAALLAGERRPGIALPLSLIEMRVIGDCDGLVLLVDHARLIVAEVAEFRPVAAIDESLPFFAGTIPDARLACVEDADLVLFVQLLAAAMLCGLLEAARDMAAGYARERVQFGRPIGAFQAIKHRCADIAIAAEMCWAQTAHAATALAEGADDAEFHVLAAKYLAGEEALKAARFTIQAHGGMGFTAEVDAQLLLKRAHMLRQLTHDVRGLPARLAGLEMAI